jgi:phosphopantetheine adenylyltransferase
MDYNYEEALAQFNDEYAKFKDDEIETIYFRAKFSEISSTMIYTFMNSGVPVDKYLPYKSKDLLKDDNWSNR